MPSLNLPFCKMGEVMLRLSTEFYQGQIMVGPHFPVAMAKMGYGSGPHWKKKVQTRVRHCCPNGSLSAQMQWVSHGDWCFAGL